MVYVLNLAEVPYLYYLLTRMRSESLRIPSTWGFRNIYKARLIQDWVNIRYTKQ